MKTVVLTGATGVVGGRVLEQLLDHPEVGRVVALGRRAVSIEHDKLVSKVVDLQNVDAMAAAMPDDVAVAVCCLGTTMKKAGSKEAFAAVDRDAVVAFGEAARRKGAQRFLLVSSIGADVAARTFYLRVKGEAEQALSKLGFDRLTVLRPSFIDDEGTRTDDRLGERLGLPVAKAVFSILGRTHRYAPIRATTIAKALVRLAFDDDEEKLRIVQSDRIHALGA